MELHKELGDMPMHQQDIQDTEQSNVNCINI